MNIAIVGATGKVGNKFIEVLEERGIKADNFYLYASKKSAGRQIKVFDKEYSILELNEKNIKDKRIDYALFSAGGTISKEFAPIFARYGAVVIDNSSAFRQDTEVPLVVPEVNKEDILNHHGIISNPNCSTIQMVLPLKVLNDKYKVKRVVVSTYQAVSGAGQKGCDDLNEGMKSIPPKKFVHQIFSNVIPHIDDFLENGYTREEEKMSFETKKILHDESILVTATTVRVPVFNVHSESVNVELEKEFDIDQIRRDFEEMDNLVVLDDIRNNLYPMPCNVDEQDKVFVGRIRRDETVKNGLNIWVVADNIRKGAATNAVQILECLLEYKKEGR